MSETRGTKLTYAGLNLLAACQTGKELHFTRVVMGSGKITAQQDIRQLEGLVKPEWELPIKDVKITGTGTTTLETQLKNQGLKTGFTCREIGIFALDADTIVKTTVNGETTYTGTEILYAYRNTDDDSEYLPASGGADIVDIVYEVVTVIDQAENVTAVINGDIAYVTRVDFQEHVDAACPHPNAPSLKADIDHPDTPDYFWAQKNHDKHLHSISLDNARTAILGDQASTIPVMRGRINQLEAEIGNIGLEMLAKSNCPDSNLMIYEDFATPDKVDVFSVAVKAVTAGSNAIEVTYLDGIYRGAVYWLTDGVRQEQIQVKSVAKNGSIYRILAKENIVNTYNIPSTMIYRTTADIRDGIAMGSSDRKGITWSPSTTWTGQKSNVQTTTMLQSTLDKADNFTLSGDTSFDADGFMTLDTTIKHAHGMGIALVHTGGGAGTWARTDENGDDYVG